MFKYTISLVGRTNVGKSTLFNKLIEENRALTSNRPNTTRDRNYGNIIWQGEELRVVDTGGLDAFDFLNKDYDNEIESQILEQTHKSFEEADLVLFVVDGRDGILYQEKALAASLKESSKPVILVVNKIDSTKIETNLDVNDFIKLNFGEPFLISAKSGRGSGDLLDEVFEKLKKIKKKKSRKVREAEDLKPVKITLLGKPNAGKSSLLNAILSKDHAITSPIEHTTREPQDVMFNYKKQPFVIVDTAGIRKKSNIKKGIELFGVNKSWDSLREADVVLLVIDVNRPLSTQDNYLADKIRKNGCGLVIVVNKWDLIENKGTNTINEYEKMFYNRFPYLWWAPILFTSALTKQRVKNVLDMSIEIVQKMNQVIDKNDLKDFAKKIIAHHKPVKAKGVIRPRVKEFTQIDTNPPQFLVELYPGSELHRSYLKYIENQLRKQFDFSGSPIKIEVEQPKAIHGVRKK